jgi:hypothetical protein
MENLKKRISEALENELAAIYEEQNIQSGDIDPLQHLEWDRITTATANLFAELIEQNK